MSKSIRVNEYYDLFDIKTEAGLSRVSTTNLPTTIKPNNEYNTFHGFNNFPITDDSSSIQPYNAANSQYVQIAGKDKSPQAASSIRIDKNGDIWCYPPNVSVPYWSRIIFRNFDYNYNNNEEVELMLKQLANVTVVDKFDVNITKFPYSDLVNNNEFSPVPKGITIKWTADDVTNHRIDYHYAEHEEGDEVYFPLWNINTNIYKYDISLQDVGYPTNFPNAYKTDFTNVYGFDYNITISDELDRISLFSSDKVPLFLRFDEYQSRSKVIFSGCDKTRNPDIEYSFNYHKGQMEPIKLNLSLSANVPVRDFNNGDTYNQNLTKEEIENYLNTCYWCIEWICDKDSGN